MIGDVIKELRMKKKLTQKQLAERLDLAQSTVAMIESNKREVSLENLTKFADFFNVSTDYILGNERKEFNKESKYSINSTSLSTIAAHFEGEEFTERDLEDIESFINFVLSKK